MARKRYLVVVVALSVIALAILGAWSLYEVTESVTDAYSMECMSLVIVEHLRSEDAWPTSYEDLADDYQVVLNRTGGVGPWSEVCNRVNVHFDIDIETAASDTRFISLMSGRQAELSNPHPNERISNYLRNWHRPPNDDATIRIETGT